MLSDSVYNYATSRRGTSTTDQDSGDSQLEAQTDQMHHQLSSMQKPRNKRKNFKPISSRMAEVSDEESGRETRDDDSETIDDTTNPNDVLEFERKTMIIPPNDETSKQRLNNNEASPMDLSVAPRPPSSDGDEGSVDSLRHKFILEQLRSQTLYTPSVEVNKKLDYLYFIYHVSLVHDNKNFLVGFQVNDIIFFYFF